jgi:phosphomannomutase
VEEVDGATDAHIKTIIDALGPLPPATRKLRVVLDSCNGAGSIVGPKLLEALGVEVIAINVTPDGSFPRPAEPLPENLADLCAAVKKQGVPIGEDYTLVLATLYVLGREPGPVVANLSTTSALEDVAKKFNCPIFLTKIGEVNVTDKMQQQNAVIGGEGNGGVIYPRINFARDSLVGMALVLHLLADSGKTITHLLDQFPRYTVVKEKMICPSDKIAAVLKMLRQEYGNYPLDTRDGVKVTLPHGWFLVRGSNTEPIIRVVAESNEEEKAREIVARVYEQVARCIN